MSKIIKSSFVSFSDQKKEIRVIDTNHPKIIQSSVKAVQDGFEESDDEHYEHQHSEIAHDNEPTHNNISADSKFELNHNEFEEAKNEAYQKGYGEGYDNGHIQGYEDGYKEGKELGFSDGQVVIKKEREQNQNELEILKESLIQEYDNCTLDLEPKMLSVIENLVIKLIGVQKVSKGTIMHLIKCGLDELELHGDLVIKVSSFDLDYVIERRDELTEELSEKIKVEILKDQQLIQNECVIETEMGTIDCSLGTQLEGLLNELRLIKESMTRQ